MVSRQFSCFASAIAFGCIAGVLWADPGFGTLRKRKMELHIRQPAAVRLTNTSIAFVGTSTNQEYLPVQGSLLATLETELISNDRTLVKVQNRAGAEWVLDLKVTGFSIARPQNRTQAVGNSSLTTVRWNGSLNAAYQVLDKGGRAHAADNISYAYEREVDGTAAAASPRTGLSRLSIPHLGLKKNDEPVPHTADDVKQILIHEVVRRIAAKLGNTSQTIEVQIAAGDDRMSRAADFMEKHLWSRASEELDSTPAYSKPEEEAYRQYNLGLVYEAMSYESKSSNDQRENLFKAQEYYDKALEMNRKERYFVETVARTKDAVARFKTLDQMRRDDQKAKTPVRTATVAAPVQAAKQPASAVRPAKAQSKAIRLGDVLEMAAAGVPEDQIVEVIRNSAVEFNPTDKDTVVAIAKAKLPVRIQNELRRKVGAPLLGASAPSGATKSAVSK